MRTARIEGRRSARELAEAGGFRLEDHHAVTADGFVLVLHRLVDPDRMMVSALFYLCAPPLPLRLLISCSAWVRETRKGLLPL